VKPPRKTLTAEEFLDRYRDTPLIEEADYIDEFDDFP
jgi:hypothetical protein